MKNLAMGILAGLAMLFVFTGCDQDRDDDFLLRINCGETKAYTDARGNVWQPDQVFKEGTWGYVDGETVDRGTGVKIADTDLTRVFQTERYSMSAYRICVPNDKYTVGLLFAETFDKLESKGERVYSVSVNGVEVLPKLDLIEEAGGTFKAFTKVYEVKVKDGEIKVEFKASVQNPAINGIVIVEGTGGKERKLVQQGVTVESK